MSKIKKMTWSILICLALLIGVILLVRTYNIRKIRAYRARGKPYISEAEFKDNYLVSSLVTDILFYELGHNNDRPNNLDSFKIDSRYREDVYYSPSGFEDNTGQKWLIVFLDRDNSRYIVGTIKDKDVLVKHIKFKDIWFKNMKFPEVPSSPAKSNNDKPTK